MLLYQTKPIVLDLDDFCEEIMTNELWGLIHLLKKQYPKLKITMFTIPLLCSEAWLTMVQTQYPWIEMHYHGSDHKNPTEWLEISNSLNLPHPQYFHKGFKAPWWRLGQTTAELLRNEGYLISSRLGQRDIEGRAYRFNVGTQHMRDVWYENDLHHAVHSHVQHQKLKDGLPDGNVLDSLCGAFPKNSDFWFVSELSERGMI